MADEPTTPPEGGEAGPLAGERLAAERRKREISIHDIARDLHLDEPKVLALEQNAFDKLGAPVFAKGYLRKYAEVVGMPVDDILADYYRLNRAAPAPLTVGYRSTPARDVAVGPWLLGGLVLLVVAGGVWWWLASDAEWLGSGDEAAIPSSSAGRVAEQRTVNELLPTEPAQQATSEAATDEPAEAESAAVNEQPVEPAADPRTASTSSTAGAVELSMTFSGDCWTEVTDAAGERLYFGLGSAGRAVTVAGAPPLQVLLGNSENVRLAVNGSSYSIPQSARRGDTARLTITDR